MSVNTMTSNLTTKVHGFTQISAAAIDGDLRRFIDVEARAGHEPLSV